MVERKNYSQLELFSQSEDPGRRINNGRNFFLGYVRSYEKAILLSICFIAAGIISFSLGVEKGKRLAVSKSIIRLDLAAKTPKPDSQKNSLQATVSKPLAPAINKNNDLQNYTIQLASYQSKTYAKKQAELLKKKGFTALVLPKGNYIILCVGNFANKETARPLLSELRKTYQDSFIRRL